MIFTSYFAHIKNHPRVVSGELRPMSISLSAPQGWPQDDVCYALRPWPFMVIEELVKTKHEFPYATIVPLIAIFGAKRLPDKKGNYDWRNPLDEKINYDHNQAELLTCLAPEMIGALHGEIQSATPQKKRGDVFKDWLGIQIEKLYAEAVEEIPEPKSWAN